MSAPDSRCQPEGAHTPTPWRIFTNPDGTKLIGIGDKDGQGILDAGFGVWSWNDPEGIANAELVVKAVNDHRYLTIMHKRFVAYLSHRYNDGEATEIAKWCDEILDSSGRLLGEVREAARSDPLRRASQLSRPNGETP